jgi:fucose permease
LSPSSARRARARVGALEGLAALAFLVFGGALVLPGAVQPALEAALGLDLAASGLVASALSLGLGLGVVAGGPLADRLPRKPVFVGAAGLAAAAALALVSGGPFAAVLAATAGIGFGAGVYETLLNAAVAERAPASAAARLSLIHACATLGAGLGAPALGALATGRGFPAPFASLGLGFAALALLALPTPFRQKGVGPVSSETPAGEAKVRPLSELVPLGVGSFAYVGLETALSVFAVPHAAGHGYDAARGMQALSAFWVGLFAARVVFAALRRPARPAQLRAVGLVGAAALGAAAFGRGLAPEVGFLAVGLALGIVFPVLVTLAGEAWPTRRATAVGLVVGAGSLGGFAVPWAAGAIGDRLGPAAAVASLASLALLIAAAASRRARR